MRHGWLLLVAVTACGAAPAPAVVAASETKPTPGAEATSDPQAIDDAPPETPHFQSRTIPLEAPRPHYSGRPIDLDVKDADIHNVCRLLADVGKVNIVLGDGISGTVTLTMHHVPWDQVLDSVLQAKGLRMEREGNVILVFAQK